MSEKKVLEMEKSVSVHSSSPLLTWGSRVRGKVTASWLKVTAEGRCSVHGGQKQRKQEQGAGDPVDLSQVYLVASVSIHL